MRILFVGFQDSIHVAQWLKLLDRTRYDVHLYCPYAAPLTEDLENVTVHVPRLVCHRVEDQLLNALDSLAKYLEHRPFRRLSLLLTQIQEFCSARAATHRAVAEHFSSVSGRNVTLEYTTGPIPTIWAAFAEWVTANVQRRLFFISPPYGATRLQKLVRRIHPVIIHSMEFQLNGYLVMQAKDGFGRGFPTWVASNYGSDLYYFSKFPEHKSKLRRLLSRLDYYSCECHRDIGLAKALGLQAEALSVIPNCGGINFDKVRQIPRQEPTSLRRVIAVKGYENWSGRAILALQALERCADVLSDYEIVVYRPDVACVDYVRSLVNSPLRIRLQPHTSHAKILEMLGRSRVLLGVSLSDGVSTAMLEAMAMGAFPVQTCTSCADEWIDNGRSGFVVPLDIDGIASKIRQAIADDELVDRASRENWRVCNEKANSKEIGRIVMNQYETISSSGKPRDVAAEDVLDATPFTPKVSIIIPVYNGSKYIKNAIDDALNQTYENCEVLVVDDGSKDDTRQLVEVYGEKVRYFWKPNGGVASALNLGIEQMTGSYFSWLSHDDGYMPEKVACQIDYLRRETDREGVVFYSDYEVMDEQGKTFHACRWDHEMLLQKPLYGLLRGLVHGCSLLIPKTLFSRIGRFDESLRVTQDYALWFKMIRFAPFKHIPQVLVRSRWHPEQDSKTKSTQYVIPECNGLWIKFQEDLTEQEILSCEETKGRFFWELARFLETTPYDKARQFAYGRAVEQASDLSVSVILPFHNQIASTWQALESARNQTHQRLQIIVIDDGSTEAVDNLHNHAIRDPRVVWLKQQHAGPGSARNSGLGKATGDFIAFLNPNSSWEANKVEIQLRNMIANNWAISHTSHIRVWDNGSMERIASAAREREELPGLIGHPVSTASVMVRRDLFERRRFPEEVLFGEDSIAWLDIAAEHPVWGIDLPLVKEHLSRSSVVAYRQDRSVGLQNVYNFVSRDARFEKYGADIQRLLTEMQNVAESVPLPSAQDSKQGKNMNSLLKQLAMLVPPLRRYVENHRVVVRELEILRERERHLVARTAHCDAEIASLRASLDRLGAETGEVRANPKG